MFTTARPVIFVLAAVALAEGDPSHALELVDQALVLYQDRSDPIELGRTLVLRSSIRLQQGDAEAARRDLIEAQEIFERIGAVPDLQMVRRHQTLIEAPE